MAEHQNLKFRFPEEIRQLLRVIINEPVGFPGGEPGDIFVADIEKAIHEHTENKDSSMFVLGRNFPNLSTQILIRFSTHWLTLALNQIGTAIRVIKDYAEAQEQPVQRSLQTEVMEIAKKLRELADAYEKLSEPEKI